MLRIYFFKLPIITAPDQSGKLSLRSVIGHWKKAVLFALCARATNRKGVFPFLQVIGGSRIVYAIYGAFALQRPDL